MKVLSITTKEETEETTTFIPITTNSSHITSESISTENMSSQGETRDSPFPQKSLKMNLNFPIWVKPEMCREICNDFMHAKFSIWDPGDEDLRAKRCLSGEIEPGKFFQDFNYEDSSDISDSGSEISMVECEVREEKDQLVVNSTKFSSLFSAVLKRPKTGFLLQNNINNSEKTIEADMNLVKSQS